MVFESVRKQKKIRFFVENILHLIVHYFVNKAKFQIIVSHELHSYIFNVLFLFHRFHSLVPHRATKEKNGNKSRISHHKLIKIWFLKVRARRNENINDLVILTERFSLSSARNWKFETILIFYSLSLNI